MNSGFDQCLDLYRVSIISINLSTYRLTFVRLGHDIHGAILLLDLLYLAGDAFLDTVQQCLASLTAQINSKGVNLVKVCHSGWCLYAAVQR